MKDFLTKAQEIESSINKQIAPKSMFSRFFSSSPSNYTIADSYSKAASSYLLASSFSDALRCFFQSIKYLSLCSSENFKIAEVYTKISLLYKENSISSSFPLSFFFYYSEKSAESYLSAESYTMAAKTYSNIASFLSSSLQETPLPSSSANNKSNNSNNSSTSEEDKEILKIVSLNTKEEILGKIVECYGHSYKFYKMTNSNYTAHSELILKADFEVLKGDLKEAEEDYLEVIGKSDENTSRFRDLKICFKITLIALLRRVKNEIDNEEEIVSKINSLNGFFSGSEEYRKYRNVKFYVDDEEESEEDKEKIMTGIGAVEKEILNMIFEVVEKNGEKDMDLC